MNKKLLILGAGEAQLALIKEAQSAGIYTIVCDMRPDMEGSRLADKYYQVNYMDRSAVLEVAVKEKIDGVISNSEPAMINVAWLSEQLELPGNTEKSVNTLLSKTEFRNLQHQCGIFAPKNYAVHSETELFDVIQNIKYPFVIKPVLSSGTRGTTVIYEYDREKILQVYYECKEFSRNNEVAVEEYVKMNSLTAYDAELFVCNDQILWDGLYASVRSADAPMLPIMETLPLMIPDWMVDKIKEYITEAIKSAGIKLGEYNAETYFTEDGECFLIEINPRQAGNHIPDLVFEHSGINFTRLLCTTAVGDYESFNTASDSPRLNRYVAMYVVFSEKNGILKGVHFSDDVKPYIQWYSQLIANGEEVHKKSNAGDSIAFVRMAFDTAADMNRITAAIDQHIIPVVE